MRTLGLIGGMSWESTALYYRQLNELARHRLGGLHSARVVIESVDFATVVHYQQTEPERLIEIDWKPSDPTQRYSTDIKIELVDRLGLLEDIGKLFSEAKTFIQAIRTRSLPNHTAIMQISFDAIDTAHITAMTVRLQRLTDVMDIHRLGANEAPVE